MGWLDHHEAVLRIKIRKRTIAVPILRLTDTGSAMGGGPNRCWAWFTMEDRGGFLRERLFNRDRTFRAMTCVAQRAGARMRIRRGGFLPLR